MGIFGGTSTEQFDDEVEKATDEKNTDEDWSTIMNICDKAGRTNENARGYLKSISKRLFNSDPHIGLQAVTLLDACIKNCGKTFHIEVASRDFENDISRLMSKGQPHVSKKLRESLKKWAENEFKSDPQLNLIPSLYSKLKSQGHDFSSTDNKPAKKSSVASKDPNVIESQEEEEAVMKAIELSLKESTGSPKVTSTSLYPSTNLSNSVLEPSTNTNSTTAHEPKKVRALYDFEAAEDNELTFNTGEVIFVIDDSDANWWKGSNQRGEGLFPSNFVTSDLSVEPEKFLYDKAKKSVQFNEEVEVNASRPEDVIINEQKIDRLLNLLHEADPTNPDTDSDEMLVLEREVNAMGPLIDTELEKVDRKHAQLTQLSADLVEALGLYHTLMKDPSKLPGTKMAYGYSQVIYNGTQPLPNMPPHSMMGPTMSSPGMSMNQGYMHPSAMQHMPNFQQNPVPNTIAPPGVPHGMNIPQNIPEERKSDSNIYYG